MADIEMRFHRDMLALSAPADTVLARQGVDLERDAEFALLLEPDAVQSALRMEAMAGAQCLVAPTRALLPARLAHERLTQRGAELAAAACGMARNCKPQHLLVELGPCGLPFDRASKQSLLEHKGQYKRAAAWFEAGAFDAYLLSSFDDADELKCALMGLRQASDRSVFATVSVDAQGATPHGDTLEAALAVAAEYGAAVAGFRTPAPPAAAADLVRRAVACCDLPVLVELEVGEPNRRQFEPTDANPYYCADTLADAAVRLHAAGAQFLRAVGQATPAYTGALALTVAGADVRRPGLE